jgi:hypothetical protein
MNKMILLGLVILNTSSVYALAPKNGEQPTYCEQIVAIHGLLTRAQVECGYSKYNKELISDSKKCFKHELGEEYGMEVLKFGLMEYDRHVREEGKELTCKSILKEFPEYVQK